MLKKGPESGMVSFFWGGNVLKIKVYLTYNIILVGMGLLRLLFNISRGHLCLHRNTSLYCNYTIVYIKHNLIT